MKAHTNNFKEQIKLIGKEIDSKITFGDTVLGKSELNAVTPSFQSSILKSAMKQLDIDSNVYIPVGSVLKYEFGLKVNGEYEYINFGNYIVKDIEKQEDTNSYKITCYDKMLLSMKDYAKMPITYPITIRDYINSLCTFLGLRFANVNDTFVNYNKTIPTELYLDSEGNSLGYTFRDVFDELSQVTASTICINNNDEVEIRYINDTGDTIDEEYLKDVNVNFGEKYGKVNSIVLSRSGQSDNVYLQDEASIAENGLTELKIIDNQIMNFNNRSDYLPEIFEKLNGLEYYLNDFSSTGITYYDICDRYNVKIGDVTYSCVMFNDEILVTQGLQENVFTEMPEETQTDYTKADKTDRKINQTYIIVDKQNQQIESVVSQTNAQNEKIAKVTQTVDELNSKISDIADITISQESNNGYLEFEDINQSEPIRIVVRPISESISYLYPHNNLYPSNLLYSKNRKIRFTNIKTEEIFDYELPTDLLYYNSENYDEFILDYDAQSCVVNKKVGYNADGTTYVLDTPTTLEFEYPRIFLTDGDYKIEILGYDMAYLFVRLMAQNIYTTQFATRAEVSSEISQTAQEINLEVSKKVNETEVVSTINQSAEQITLSSNRLVVNSDNFKLDAEGNMTCNDATLRNANFVNGAINITQEQGSTTLPILLNQTSNSGNNYNTRIGSAGIIFLRDGKYVSRLVTSTSNGGGELYIYNINGNVGAKLWATEATNGGYLRLYDSSGADNIYMSGPLGSIRCKTLNQTSLKENKKNFEKFNGALNIINDIDLYKYNLDIEKDNDKKHIGFVIGDGYKYSSEITAIDENGKEIGVDLYSMTSLCLQAIKEQQKLIEELKEEIKQLKESE